MKTDALTLPKAESKTADQKKKTADRKSSSKTTGSLKIRTRINAGGFTPPYGP